MKRYIIRYFKKDSEYTNCVFVLGEQQLNESIKSILIKGGWIYEILSKDEKETASFYWEMENKNSILASLCLLTYNRENEFKYNRSFE